jgi:hypothetical protein
MPHYAVPAARPPCRRGDRSLVRPGAGAVNDEQ